MLVANEERVMNLMMRTFEKYVREKDLTVNASKTKVSTLERESKK